MITINGNKNTSIIVSQTKKQITVGDKTYPFPKGVRGNSISTINNRSYVDGYELIDGEWKKTLRALWHIFF